MKKLRKNKFLESKLEYTVAPQQKQSNSRYQNLFEDQFSSEPSSRYNQRTELTKNSYQDTYATHQKPSNNRYRNQYDYDDDDDDY
jgi:hypothetical protein